MFERLTRWENNDKDVADLIEEKSDFDGLTEAINRLAEYEDSGLSPEEVQELAKAKADGRLKILPANGVSDDIFNDLVNALDKAIMLIYDMSIRKVALPGDMIYRWENLVRYARARESVEKAKPTCKTMGLPCCRCQPGSCEHRGDGYGH